MLAVVFSIGLSKFCAVANDVWLDVDARYAVYTSFDSPISAHISAAVNSANLAAGSQHMISHTTDSSRTSVLEQYDAVMSDDEEDDDDDANVASVCVKAKLLMLDE